MKLFLNNTDNRHTQNQTLKMRFADSSEFETRKFKKITISNI